MGMREDLEGYKREVDLSQEVRGKEVSVWQNVADFYRSEPPTTYPDDDWKVQVNWVYAWIESMLPSLTFQNPRFSCAPMNPTSVESSKTTEAAINGELTKIGLRTELYRAALDGLLYGTGVMQLGYYDGGLVPDPKANSKGGEAKEEIDLSRSESSDVPYGYEEGSIYVKHVPTDSFLIDPMATGMHDALWCGFEFMRPLSMIKKDPQYKSTENLSGDDFRLPPSISLEDYKNKFDRYPEKDYVRLYQIWDIAKRRVVTFARGHERFLQIRTWDLPVKRFPFFLFKATQDNIRFWNQSPIVPWLSLVNEYNLTVSNRVDHMSRNKAKVVYNGGTIDDAEFENLMASRNLTAIKLDLSSEDDVRKHVAPIQMAQLPAEHWQHIAETRQRITEISGQSEFDQGGTRPGERPAAEIERISAGADHRRLGIGLRLTTSLSELARDTRAIMQRYYSSERVVEIIDEGGESEWVQYSGNNLRGEYSFTCNIEELAPETKSQRQQKAAMALQLLTPFSQVASPIPRVDIDPILKKVAEDLDLTPWIRFFPSVGPPIDPAQEWYLIMHRGQQIEPNDQDDHAYHIFTHRSQVQHPLTTRDPEAQARLRTHMEMHEAKQLALQMSAEGQEEVQKSQQGSPGGLGAGAPGPAAGSPSNNEGGGAGPLSSTVGGAAGGNLASLLNGGI